jgi:hypothetical protein
VFEGRYVLSQERTFLNNKSTHRCESAGRNTSGVFVVIIHNFSNTLNAVYTHSLLFRHVYKLRSDRDYFFDLSTLPISRTYFVNVETKSFFTSLVTCRTSYYVYLVHICLIENKMFVWSTVSQASF